MKYKTEITLPYIKKTGARIARIVTGYGLGSSGFEPQWRREIFSSLHPSWPVPRPTQLVKLTMDFFLCKVPCSQENATISNMSQTRTVHDISFHFFKNHFKIILPPTPTSRTAQ